MHDHEKYLCKHREKMRLTHKPRWQRFASLAREKKRDKKRYADKAERIAVGLGKIGLVVQTIIHQS